MQKNSLLHTVKKGDVVPISGLASDSLFPFDLNAASKDSGKSRQTEEEEWTRAIKQKTNQKISFVGFFLTLRYSF